MTSDMQHAPVALPTRQRGAAWIALTLSLIFPLIAAFNAIVIQTQNLSNGGSIVVESLSNRCIPLSPISCGRCRSSPSFWRAWFSGMRNAATK